MESTASSMPSIWTSLNSWFTPTVFFLLLNLMIATIVFTSNLTNNHQQRKAHSQNAPNQPTIDRSPSILHRLKSFNFYPTRSQQEFSPANHHQQALQVAATQYVFNQSLHHDHDVQTLSAHDTHFDFGPTPSDEVAATDTALHAGFNQTHFVWEQKQSLEMVTTHFHSDPTHEENPKDTGLEDPVEEQRKELESLDEVYSKLKGGHANRTKSDTQPEPSKLREKMKKSASSKSSFPHFEKVMEARRPASVRERKSEVRVEEDDVEVDAKADDFINKFRNDLKLQRIDSIIRSKDAASRGAAK